MKKRADGRYLKVITIKGKRHYIYGDTVREVNQKVMALENKNENGAVTFNELADEWWDEERPLLSPSTELGYNGCLKKARAYFGDTLVGDITAADVVRFLVDLKKQGFAKKTISNHKIVVSRVLHHGVIAEYIETNVAREAELPRNLPEKKRSPAKENEERIIAEGKWLMPMVALYTGMRRGEILGLKVKDIDLEGGTIRVERSVWYAEGGKTVLKDPKTEAGKRVIPILAPLRAPLAEAVKNAPREHFLFGGKQPLSSKAQRVLWRKFQRESGCLCTLHQLRKSFATFALEADVPADVLQVIIGHADISTTLKVYNEVRAAKIKSATDSLNARLSAPEIVSQEINS